MKAKTFEEWHAAGYHVIKGQKATGRNKQGVATFKENQVNLNEVRPFFSGGSSRPSAYTRPNGEQAGYIHDMMMEQDVDYDDPLTHEDFGNF